LVTAPNIQRGRWAQLAFGVIAMITIANLQYGWTLFVQPLQDGHGWSKSAIQFAFFLFVLFETWTVPLNGWLVDRFGPRPFVALAGILIGAGWFLSGHAETLGALYVAQTLAGIGAGFVYGTMVAIAVKWFPDRRGLAVGLTAAGFGAGAALTVVPIAKVIASSGYAAAFQNFGLVQGVIVVLLAFALRFPRNEEIAAVTPVASPALARQRRTSSTPLQMLKTPQFYLLYVMMVMIATGLLFMTAQVAPIAKDYGVAKTPIDFFGLAIATLPFALLVDNLANGGSRILFGWVSDTLGREVTMAIAFSCEALGLVGLIFAQHNPWLFILCAAATFVASGEIYSLFPASCTDLYGPKYAATNSGLLYTAKGTATIIVPLASAIHDATGSWAAIIGVLVAFNVIVAALAVAVLKPMRERFVAQDVGEVAPREGVVPASAAATVH
jgi:OFA family oxalate/formate antiporter-like MFS transporter